jgi:hypothetical protein
MVIYIEHGCAMKSSDERPRGTEGDIEMTTYQDLPASAVGEQRAEGALLICRLEGELHGASESAVGPESVCLVHDFEADVVGGPLSGRHLTGLNQLTVRTDGIGLVAGPATIDCEAGSVSLDIRGYVVAPPDIGWPRPEAISARAYDFPDHDYRVTGSALVRSAHPSYAYLDGMTASIEGWINFESGEVEVEARAM